MGRALTDKTADRIDLTAAAAQVQTVLQGIEADSCPRLYNFHLHTTCSDGKLQPREVMEQAIAIGLRGLAITDHHGVRGYEAACAWLEDYQWRSGGRSPLPKLWVGTEINADLQGTEVHILAYGFQTSHVAMRPYLVGRPPQGDAHLAPNVIAAIQQAGGLAILAHPARYRRSPQELILAAYRYGIDGVETYYAYGNPNPWQATPEPTQAIASLAAELNLLSSCGTDTHGRSLLSRL